MYNFGMTKKYIWPRDIADAGYWYLTVLSEFAGGASLDDIVSRVLTDPSFGARPSRRQAQRKLYNLVDAGWLERQGSYKQASYAITDEGRNRLSQLEQLSFSRSEAHAKAWDKRWRIVIFDIPETQREARYQIRRLLKELGFVQLQLSVWIHPLPLLEAFRRIQTAYGVAEHLFLLEVVDFVPPAKTKAHFNKRYPTLIFS